MHAGGEQSDRYRRADHGARRVRATVTEARWRLPSARCVAVDRATPREAATVRDAGSTCTTCRGSMPMRRRVAAAFPDPVAPALRAQGQWPAGARRAARRCRASAPRAVSGGRAGLARRPASRSGSPRSRGSARGADLSVRWRRAARRATPLLWVSLESADEAAELATSLRRAWTAARRRAGPAQPARSSPRPTGGLAVGAADVQVRGPGRRAGRR